MMYLVSSLMGCIFGLIYWLIFSFRQMSQLHNEINYLEDKIMSLEVEFIDRHDQFPQYKTDLKVVS